MAQRSKRKLRGIEFYDPIAKHICRRAGRAVMAVLFNEWVTELKELTTEHRTWLRRQHDYIWQSGSAIYHIEFQFRNDKQIAFRMIHYHVLLQQKYPDCIIHSVVVYLGREACTMPNELKTNQVTIKFDLIDLAAMDAIQFLDAPNIELQLLAIVAKQEKPIEVIDKLLDRLAWVENPNYRFELFDHLHILSNIRNLTEILETEAMRKQIFSLFDIQQTSVNRPIFEQLKAERAAKEQAELAKEQAELAKEQAELAKERFAAKLRELDIDPETLLS